MEEDEEVAQMIGAIREISHLPLLNLNGKDNAYLKETYGADNFDYMTTVADNFDRLQMLLVDYAKVLMQKDRINDAILILEYGVSVGSDISSNYTLLGECYQATGQLSKIPALKEKLQQLHMLLEPSILSYLDSLENQ
jgi:predicted Zn-dependent protease